MLFTISILETSSCQILITHAGGNSLSPWEHHLRQNVKFLFLPLEVEELWSCLIRQQGKKTELWTIQLIKPENALVTKQEDGNNFYCQGKKKIFPAPKSFCFGEDQAFYIVVLLLSAILILDKDPPHQKMQFLRISHCIASEEIKHCYSGSLDP